VPDLRFGIGFDSHERATDRPLYVGGVHFEGEPGLAGHSDADVLCHALADAFLGAAGLDDIGQHFPDTDPKFAGIGGLELLAETVDLVRQAGSSPHSCDAVVIAEGPSIATRRDEIRANLAKTLGIDEDRVSVKGKRPEGLNLAGGAAACLALAVLE
jgi:2-C-methyl-D-erythritol 2,4-cyclodiphosphate synthase